MKISAENIDYNTVRMIDENTDPWALSWQSDDMDNERLIMLGYIRGVIDMAMAMKEVLNA